ncbi:MAG: phosphotransferase [Acidimicrobiia bacterium]
MSPDWSVLYPHRRTPWAAVAADGVTPIRYHPDSAVVEPADPFADSALPGLAALLDGHALVSYRPGRRAVLTGTRAGRRCYLKVVRPSKAAELASRHALMAQAASAAGLDVPEILSVEAAKGVVVLSALDGPTLHSALWRTDPGSLAGLGASLARLAATPAPEGAARREVDAAWWLEVVRRWDPDATAGMCERIEALLPGSAGVPSTALVHGDLHDKNLIVTRTGFGIIDLDSSAAGPDTADLTGLLAHVELRAAQADVAPAMRDRVSRSVLHGFSSVRPVDVDGLSAAVAGELARLVCVYRFRRPGAEMCERLLGRAERLARGRS